MIGPMTAVANGVTRTFTWRGGATRSEYWFYVLFCWLTMTGLVFTSGALESRVVAGVAGLVMVLMWFSLLSAMIRRLHDTGRSGAWVWIALVPFIGGLWLLLLMTEPSHPHVYGSAVFPSPAAT
jgi:uncharacterized membrane protein YhaH (DUF805 family)